VDHSLLQNEPIQEELAVVRSDGKLNEYGAVLTMLKDSGGFISIDRLPASKAEIKEALIAVARVSKSRGDFVEGLHKGYMFLAYFVSREEAAIMARFYELGRESLTKGVSNSHIVEIIQEIARDRRHIEIQQRASDEFSGLFREFEAEVAKTN
jgi:hypothetical protein